MSAAVTRMITPFDVSTNMRNGYTDWCPTRASIKAQLGSRRAQEMIPSFDLPTNTRNDYTVSCPTCASIKAELGNSRAHEMIPPFDVSTNTRNDYIVWCPTHASIKAQFGQVCNRHVDSLNQATPWESTFRRLRQAQTPNDQLIGWYSAKWVARARCQ